MKIKQYYNEVENLLEFYLTITPESDGIEWWRTKRVLTEYISITVQQHDNINKSLDLFNELYSIFIDTHDGNYIENNKRILECFNKIKSLY